jgi:hypothetical protein
MNIRRQHYDYMDGQNFHITQKIRPLDNAGASE